MKLVWLRNTQSCSIDLSMVKDWAGLPLVFKPPPSPSSRKLVSDAVAAHPSVKRCLDRGLLAKGREVVKLPPAPAPSVESPPVPPEPPSAPWGEEVSSSPVPEGYVPGYDIPVTVPESVKPEEVPVEGPPGADVVVVEEEAPKRSRKRRGPKTDEGEGSES